MPREQINYPKTLTTWVVPLPEGVEMADPSLHVEWSAAGGWVQTSLVVEDAHLKLMAAADNGPVPGATAIHTPVLSRDELNKLIRVLRRARDQAYGRDE